MLIVFLHPHASNAGSDGRLASNLNTTSNFAPCCRSNKGEKTKNRYLQ